MLADVMPQKGNEAKCTGKVHHGDGCTGRAPIRKLLFEMIFVYIGNIEDAAIISDFPTSALVSRPYY